LKSIEVTAPSTVEIVDRPIPEYNRDEVLVKTLYSAISPGTEISIYRNKYRFPRFDLLEGMFCVPPTRRTGTFSFPFSPGYQNVGRVVEVGSQVTGFQVGDAVVSRSPHQEYIVPTYHFAAKLPDDLDLESAPYIGLVMTTMHTVQMAEVQYRDAVAIVGQGAVGNLVMQQAKLAGASKVIAIDLYDKNLEISKACGADYVINPRKKDLPKEVRSITSERGADVVFEVGGSPSAVRDSSLLTRKRGKLVIVSHHVQPLQSDFSLGDELYHNELKVIASGPFPPPSLPYPYVRWPAVELLRESVAVVAEGKVKLKTLITHRFNYKEIKEVYEMVDKHKEDFVGIILNW